MRHFGAAAAHSPGEGLFPSVAAPSGCLAVSWNGCKGSSWDGQTPGIHPKGMWETSLELRNEQPEAQCDFGLCHLSGDGQLSLSGAIPAKKKVWKHHLQAVPREVTRGKQLISVLLVNLSCLPGSAAQSWSSHSLSRVTLRNQLLEDPRLYFFLLKNPSCFISWSGISCWGCSWHRAWGRTLGRLWHPQCRC